MTGNPSFTVTPPGDNGITDYKCGLGHLVREVVLGGVLAVLLALIVWKETSKSITEAVRLP